MANLFMGLFYSSKNELKCKKCGTVLPDSDRLKNIKKKHTIRKKKNAELVELNLILQMI